MKYLSLLDANSVNSDYFKLTYIFFLYKTAFTLGKLSTLVYGAILGVWAQSTFAPFYNLQPICPHCVFVR